MKELLVSLREGADPLVYTLVGMRDMLGIELGLAMKVRLEDEHVAMLERILQAAGREFVLLPEKAEPADEATGQNGHANGRCVVVEMGQEGQAPSFVARAFAEQAPVIHQAVEKAVQEAAESILEEVEASTPLKGRKVEALRKKRAAEKAEKPAAKKAAPKKRGRKAKAEGGHYAPSRQPVAHDARKCAHCGGEFLPRRIDQIYCYDPDCKRERNRLYKNEWVAKSRGGFVETAEEILSEVEASTDAEDAEVQEFEEMLEEEEALDPALMAVDMPDLEPEELAALQDEEDPLFVWTLPGNGDRYTEDSLQAALKERILLPGTLLRKRGGKFYTVSGLYELKHVQLAAEVAPGFVDRSRYNHNGFKEINERLGRGNQNR